MPERVLLLGGILCRHSVFCVWCGRYLIFYDLLREKNWRKVREEIPSAALQKLLGVPRYVTLSPLLPGGVNSRKLKNLPNLGREYKTEEHDVMKYHFLIPDQQSHLKHALHTVGF